MNIRVVKYVLYIVMSMHTASVFATSINYALSGTVTASSSWNNEHLPGNVIDGDASSYWNSGGFPLSWIEIDLGVSQDIMEINATVVQLPAGNTVHNIYFDNILSHTWTQFSDVGDLLTWVLPTNINAQFIKIETVSSPSWVAWGDVSVLGEVSAVPVPPAVWLFGSGLIGLVGMKRKSSKLSMSVSL